LGYFLDLNLVKSQKMINAFVHIIESPSDKDLLDGRMEGKALSKAFDLANIPYSYNLVTTKTTLQEALSTKLSQALQANQKLPILHISMHGNSDGIALTNGEFLSWLELRTELTPLLNNMQGALLICMSSCFGGSGCRMAMHQDSDHPFWALVGNSNEALWADAAVAYITFYHLFFKGLTVQECVEKMKVSSGDSNFMVFEGAYIKEDWASFSKAKNLQGGLFALKDFPGVNKPN
jgi:hypothetical protein